MNGAEAKRIVSFSPPDISESEIAEVADALRSGWITTGPRTKLLERRLAAYMETGRVEIDCNEPETAARYGNRVACLSSATAAEELNLRIWGITRNMTKDTMRTKRVTAKVYPKGSVFIPYSRKMT